MSPESEPVGKAPISERSAWRRLTELCRRLVGGRKGGKNPNIYPLY